MPVTVVGSTIPDLREHAALRMEKSMKDMDKAPKKVVVGLLNNMSLGALDNTERHFTTLLESASEGFSVQLRRFALPEILEGDSAQAYRDRNYESSESLPDAELDGLIVTGREPITPDLRDENYWGSFVQVLEWARDQTISTVWSCLAAHAAVLHMDGIQRVRSERKHSGIYDCVRIADHAMTAGVPARLRVPHSRWNGVREEDLVDAGYEMITRTEGGEVDCFVKAEKSLFVFFQGHPEYEAETLLLEYRRDVGRFLRGEASNYPGIPHGYFNSKALGELMDLQQKAVESKSDETLPRLASIFSTVDKQNGWHCAASRVYRNWLEYIYAEKMSRADMRHKDVARVVQGELDALQSLHG